MDTSTHVIAGIGLGGLSFLDPTIASHPELVAPILFCTVVGSNAPDVDFLYKYKGNDSYLKKHRGFSHSFVAQFTLSVLIASIATIGTGGQYFLTFFLWSFLAVFLHVLSDICNIYGTQAFRPFTEKWVALNVLPILDPFITGSHVIGIMLWIIGFFPGIVFAFVYGAIILYIFLRLVIMRKVRKAIHRQCDSDADITLIPTIRLTHWGVIVSDQEEYKLGKYQPRSVVWSKVLKKASEQNEIIKASRENPFVRYLMKHSPYLHAKIINQKDGYEVHWFDLRYQSKIDEPFIAIITLDHRLNLVNSDVKRGLIAAPERA